MTASAKSEYSAKPVRRLLQTIVLLVLFLAGSIAVIAAAKITGDRRLRGTILTETSERARDFINRGDYDRADAELAAALAKQPALAADLDSAFKDFQPILPRFRAAVSSN
ncbi:MAG: hypothetical protein IT366_05380 [Candidatus Hydrogenedentes bacterium]|nr:hypothetical protein [Candidatus Hydrogenedentota bacterium]